MATPKTLDIGEVVKQSGLPASTLRYYEEQGLIRSVGRHGLRRLFDARVLEQLALITLGRNAGFSLEEIGGFFTPHGPKIDKQQLRDKAQDIDRQIQELTHIRDGLNHAANCPAPSHMECPKFLRILKVVGKSQVKKR